MDQEVRTPSAGLPRAARGPKDSGVKFSAKNLQEVIDASQHDVRTLKEAIKAERGLDIPLWKYIVGESVPHVETAYILSLHLGCTVNDFMTESKEENA